MRTKLSAEQAAHDLAPRLDVANVVRSLQDILGQRAVAVIAGVSDTKAVGKWAWGDRSPHPGTEQRLRVAFQVAQLLLQKESPEAVRAWFSGMNPDLGDRAPALILAENPLHVIQAARGFVAYG